jgi:uncharacterized membrane protein YgcG
MRAFDALLAVFALSFALASAHASERYDVESTKQEAYDGHLNSVRLPGSTVYSGDKSAADWSENFGVLSSYELINDYLNLLSMEESIEIKRKLQNLEAFNGTQVVILTVPHTGKMPAYEFGRQVFSKWDIGNNGDQNGVLIILSGSGEMGIITGAGSAGALPDLECFRIARTIMTPRLKNEQYFEAFNEAVDAIIDNFKNEGTQRTWYSYLLRDNFSKVMNFGEVIKHNSDKFIAALFLSLGILWLIYITYTFFRKGRKSGS